MDFDIREVNFGDYRNEIGTLRARVWIETGSLLPSQCPDGLWLDRFEDTSTHWVVLTDGKVVASARLTVASVQSGLPYGHLIECIPGKTTGLLSRLVVGESVRKNGLARRLDEIRLERATISGASTAWGAFPSWRKAALEALGFLTVLDLSAEETMTIDGYRLPSAVMRRDLV